MTRAAAAAEQFREFLQALQDRGYGDCAVDYLNLIRSRDDLPEDLREVLDLEVATSLRIAAANTPHADEAARDLGAAQQYLDKFVREHPDHPESGMAYATYGDLASARAEAWLKAALATRDGEKKESVLQQARAAYLEARSAYDRGQQAYQARINSLKEERVDERNVEQPARSRPKRISDNADTEAVEARLAQVRFKLVMIDYQIAKTYLVATSPDRKEALARAAAGFDDIYQRYRAYQAGLYAHFWHGKTLFETGDLETALDTMDEVLANAPDPQERVNDRALDDLFGQAEQMRLVILARQNRSDELIAEAEEWLRDNKSSQRSDAYQRVALEAAKARLTKAEAETGAARRKSMQAVAAALGKIAARPGDSQQEAILLQRKLRAQGDDAEPASFDEAVVVADAAAAGGDWEGAIIGYTRAIELVRNGKQTPAATDVRLRHARAQWSAGQTAACLDTAEKLLDGELSGEQASAAASLAIHAALRLAASVREPAVAQERLAKVADSIVRRWPQSVEADEARIALGKTALLKGDDDRAMAAFEAVNPASQRHRSALYWSAVVHWRRYLKSKSLPSDQRDEAAMQAERHRAIEQLTTCLKAREITAASAPREQMESQVLLAEIDLDGGLHDEAAALVGPLVPAIKALPPGEQDTLATRALLTALKAQLLCKDLQSASEAAAALIDRGVSSPQAGAVLFEFARALRSEIHPADSTPAEAPSSETSSLPEQEDWRPEALVKVLEHLAKTPQASAAAMNFVADALVDLGKSDEARSQFQAVVDRADKDPQWLAGNRSLVTHARVKLLSELRTEGRFADALAQADRLVQQNPKSLAARMERAQILQTWAETEPEHYAQAITQWTELRTGLQNVRPRPKEYYDVVYNLAFCLVAQCERSGDKALARQAEQLLKSVLVLSPSLSGEEMVAKYNSLIERCQKLQESKPKAKKRKSTKQGPH